MITTLTSLALASTLWLPAAPPALEMHDARPLARPAASAFSSNAGVHAPVAEWQAGARDSLKNGAIIGAVVGGLLGGSAFVLGCGQGSLLDAASEEPASCTGAFVVGAIVGAGLGALTGAGVDALFERSPRVDPSTGSSWRKGVRVRLRF